MLDIPEVDSMIAQYMDRRTLVRCSLLSKYHHRIVTPFLWRDLSAIRPLKVDAFRQMVLDDLKQLKQDPPPAKLSVLSKYAHLIQQIDAYQDLFRYFYRDDPDPHNIINHLLIRCPDAMFRSIHMNNYALESVVSVQFLCFNYVPRTRALRLTTDHDKPVEYWMLKQILSHCSKHFKRLTLNITVRDTQLKKSVWEGPLEEDRTFPSIKYLNLIRLKTDMPPGNVWPWLWGHCSRLKSLQVYRINREYLEIFDAIPPDMLPLTTLGLGGNNASYEPICDETCAALISGGQGWQRLLLRYAVDILALSKAAMAKHYPTLVEVLIDGYNGMGYDDVIKILSLCPRLQSLITFDDESYSDDGSLLDIPTIAFIDLDPETGKLKKWACTDTLRVLQVKIVPETGRLGKNLRRQLNRVVYARLASLTKLEVIRLGHQLRGRFDHPQDVEEAVEVPIQAPVGEVLEDDVQGNPNGAAPGMAQVSIGGAGPSHYMQFPMFEYYDSIPSGIKMTIKSGLEYLANLRVLRVLDVTGLHTSISDQDVRGMFKQWPSLQTIIGIRSVSGPEAIQWIRARRVKTQRKVQASTRRHSLQ
ncbi:hypothetical protein BGX34_005734 [Mortierella sp. NVP85]|nr:hypothetical protein BGX34_005734 [Mortierella sp. NVP85]